MLVKSWFLFLLLIVFKFSSGQQVIYKTFNRLSQKDGLTSVNVKKIIKDTKGFFWIATQDGLYRFDGKTFTLYGKHKGKRSISGSSVGELLLDSVNNIMWCFTQYAGVDGINLSTGTVVIKSQQDAIPNLQSTLFLSAIVNRSEILSGTSTGLYKISVSDPVFRKINVPSMGGNLFITKLFKDNKSRIWLFTKDSGVIILNDRYSFIAKLDPKLFFGSGAAHYFYDAAEIKNVIFGVSDKGITPFSVSDNSKIEINSEEMKGIEEFTNRPVFCCASDKHNNLFFSSGGKFYKFNVSENKLNEIVQSNCPQEKSWLKSVYNICVDDLDNLWLGCQQGIMKSANSNGMFESFVCSQEENKEVHFYNINLVDDSVVNCSGTDGFYSVNTNTTKFQKQFEHGIYYYSFYEEKTGLILSNDKGTFVKRGNSLMPIEDINPGFKNIGSIIIDNHLKLNDSIIVLGTQNLKGVVCWNLKTGVVININAGEFKSNLFNYVVKLNEESFFTLSDNSIWQTNYLTNQSKRRAIVGNKKNSYSIFYDICKFKNYFVIASYGNGVVVVNNNFQVIKEYNTENGLSNNGVYKLFNWKDSLLFATSNQGLSCINISNDRVTNYYESDGLHNNAFEEGCGMINADKFYAGGINGFTIINPSKFTFNHKPPVCFINNIFIETSQTKIDTTNFQMKEFTIPNNVLQTTLSLSGINWQNPERVTFAWRIIEQSKEWVDIGNRNFVTLIGLSPGTYHLQVKAANEDGVWSEPKELILVFLPKWYQTWWFYLSIALIVAAVLYALYRYRIAQIKKQHEIRKNIATDLHDDLGSTLNSVKVFTNLAISGVKQEESLQQVKDNLTEATMSLRDMIWVLDDSLDTVDELVTRLKQFAIPVTAASDIEFIINADSEVNSRQLTKEEKRNLFLICKEAINNSIKYSGGSQIAVDVVPAGKKIKITVADNGKGFDEATIKKGYGLKNMQYRAGQIKYVVILNSLHGTEVIVSPA